jgi:ABC-type anion transport system, duplicated permease component
MIITTIIYALALSWLRLAIGMVISIIISIFVGILAGMNKTAEKIIIPIVDILQSIPILGFFPVAVFFFVNFVPLIGVEMAAVFLIITSELWNFIFAVYESVRSIPSYILEQAQLSNMSLMDKIAKIYIPSAWPRIIDNIPISWAIGLFFLSSSEIISLGTTTYQLLGIGSITFQLFNLGDFQDLYIAFISLFLALVGTHALFFRPLNEWSQKFKYEFTSSVTSTKIPWFISTFIRSSRPFRNITKHIVIPRRPISPFIKSRNLEPSYLPPSIEGNVLSYKNKIAIFNIAKILRYITYIALILITGIFIYFITGPIINSIYILENLNNFIYILTSVAYSGIRILIASAIMFPIIMLALLVATNNLAKRVLLPLILIIASFPAPLFIPLIILWFGPKVEIIAILVIISGSIWYIFYNAYSSIQLIPEDIKECILLSNLSKIQKFKKLYFPAMLPGLVTGFITAIGGAWNALIVAEWISIGNEVYSVKYGIGKLIDSAASSGDLNLMYASLIMMILVVVALDRTLWKKLYDYATSKFRYEI